MNCEKCGDAIPTNEERDFHGRKLCEDCYMDALSPARTCDPWAAHSAKNLRDAGMGAGPEVSPRQQSILDVLRETGGCTLPELAERLQIKPTDLEREIAALRHGEKVRGQLRNGVRYLLLW